MKIPSLLVTSALAFTFMSASVHAGERCTPAAAGWSDGAAGGEQICDVGIPSDRLQPITASQRMSQWCWAASIAMILTYHGHPIDQATIVQATYGRVINLPAYDGPTMTNALARAWTDARGAAFQADVHVYDAMSGRYEVDTQTVIDELRAERPLLVGTEGHAMVVTAMRYKKSPWGGVEVMHVTVRDPWPGQGRRELEWREMQPAYLATVSFGERPVGPEVTRPEVTRPEVTRPEVTRPDVIARAPLAEASDACASQAAACVSALPSQAMCVQLQAQQCMGECKSEGYPGAACQSECATSVGAWQGTCHELLRWAVVACEDAQASCEAF